jgi:hypothetical protein
MLKTKQIYFPVEFHPALVKGSDLPPGRYIPGPIFIKVRRHERRRKSERCIPLPVEWYSPVVQIRHQ